MFADICTERELIDDQYSSLYYHILPWHVSKHTTGMSVDDGIRAYPSESVIRKFSAIGKSGFAFFTSGKMSADPCELRLE